LLNKVKDLVKKYKIKYSVFINNVMQRSNQFIEFIAIKNLIKEVIFTILQHFLISKIKKILQQDCNCFRKL